MELQTNLFALHKKQQSVSATQPGDQTGGAETLIASCRS